MNNKNDLSPLALAFMGDAIHTAFVREKVLTLSREKMSNYHNTAKQFCNAKHQKEVIENLQLFDDEKEIVRKARNAHVKHGAKNFDEETYKKATAFEALVGWLYLNQNYDRLREILEFSMNLSKIKNNIKF